MKHGKGKPYGGAVSGGVGGDYNNSFGPSAAKKPNPGKRMTVAAAWCVVGEISWWGRRRWRNHGKEGVKVRDVEVRNGIITICRLHSVTNFRRKTVCQSASQISLPLPCCRPRTSSNPERIARCPLLSHKIVVAFSTEDCEIGESRLKHQATCR